MKSFHNAFMVLALAGLCLLLFAAHGAEAHFSMLALREAAERRLERERLAHRVSSDNVREEQLRMEPVESFLAAWTPHVRRAEDDKLLAIEIRSGLEQLAQRRMGLVTDQATTPEPQRQVVEGRTRRIQRVSLRASGESLAALLTWLGEAERLFPYARVESWELSPAGGSNSSLRLMLGHPLQAAAAGKTGGGQ